MRRRMNMTGASMPFAAAESPENRLKVSEKIWAVMAGGSLRLREFGDFRLDRERRLLLGRDGVSIPLPSKAFDTLSYLVEHAGRVVDKDELMRTIWPDTAVEENNLNQNISLL